MLVQIKLRDDVVDDAVAKAELGVLFALVGDDVYREMKSGRLTGAVEIGGFDIAHRTVTEKATMKQRPRS